MNSLKEKLLAGTPKEIEDLVDIGLRHRKGKEPYDYLEQWLKVGRCFAYATKDDSWGEFEKLFSIIIKRVVLAERELEQLKNPNGKWRMESYGLDGEEPYGFHIRDEKGKSLVNNEDGYFPESIARIIVNALNAE